VCGAADFVCGAAEFIRLSGRIPVLFEAVGNTDYYFV
jgi:hypothetical protein